MSALSNFLLFQLGWFACVLGAARGLPWVGPVVVTAVVAFHLLRFAKPVENWIVAVSVGLGLVVDTLLLQSGLVVYRSPTPPDALAPVWILAMWANLAVTIEHSLAWVARFRGLPFIAGALSGPAAYWAAARLGAVSIADTPVAMPVLALGWGLSLTVLVAIPARSRFASP